MVYTFHRYVQWDTGSGLPFYFNPFLEKILWSQPHGTSMCNGGLADGEFEAPRKCTEFAVLGCEQCPGPDNVYVGVSVLMPMSISMLGERRRKREQRFGLKDTLEPRVRQAVLGAWVFKYGWQ